MAKIKYQKLILVMLIGMGLSSIAFSRQPRKRQKPWWESIPSSQVKKMGLHKLSTREKNELLNFFMSVLNGSGDVAARKYLERKGWEKMTVAKKASSGKLILIDDIGRQYLAESYVGFYGIFKGDCVWLESTFGYTDMITPDGDTENAKIETLN